MPTNIDQIMQTFVVKTKGTSPSSIQTPNSLSLLNFDEQIVFDLIDCLQKPTSQITPEYVALVQRTASLLNGAQSQLTDVFRDTGARPAWDSVSFPEQKTAGYITKSVNSPTMVGSSSDSREKLRNEVNMLRNQVYDVINSVNAFVARAKNAGFAPPENPFVLAMSYNVKRVGFTQLQIPGPIVSRIVKNIIAYLALLEAEKSGKINFNQNINSSAQLSSVKFALDGFGGSGDTQLDLSKLLPDADEVKAQKANDALSVFDFSKRIPKLLFTAHYAPDGVPRGIIVGWKKVHDASGYVIKRRNVFDGNEVQYAVTNVETKSNTARLMEYMKAWVLTFYDNVAPENVCCYLDSDVTPHSYFFYKVQSYQLQNGAPGNMFNVEAAPHFISQSVKIQIRAQLEKLDPNKKGSFNGYPDTISPWPVLSQFILGDSKYDWLLAALNIRQSINRSDTRTTTRAYSYLSAQLNFLFSQADAGKLMVPKNHNVSQFIKNIGNAVSQFGTNQVIREVLQETGALYHFEGKDPNDNAMFTNVDSNNLEESGLIATVAAAIDPETATLNLRTLATNLPRLMAGEFVNIGDSLRDGVERNSSKAGGTTEIEIPDFDRPDDIRASDEIKYLQQLGDVGDGIIDLTTVDGIASFMRTVRIFSDIGPNRGAPIVDAPPPLVPDPIRPVAPAPPPRSTTQPVSEPIVELGATQPEIDAAARAAAAKANAERADQNNRAAANKELKKDQTGRGRGGKD